MQKAGTAYLERHPLKYPKRTANRDGLRPRSHLSVENRRLFDAVAKQEYYDILNDVDGNDRPDLMGILTGSNLQAADTYFANVFKKMQKLKDGNLVGDGAAAGAPHAYVSIDPNILLDSDHENDD